MIKSTKDMTRTELKEAAQHRVMCAIVDSIFMVGDDDPICGENDKVMAEAMRVQALRVMKLMGYSHFQGIEED